MPSTDLVVLQVRCSIRRLRLAFEMSTHHKRRYPFPVPKRSVLYINTSLLKLESSNIGEIAGCASPANKKFW